jgi:hypothetical protein
MLFIELNTAYSENDNSVLSVPSVSKMSCFNIKKYGTYSYHYVLKC